MNSSIDKTAYADAGDNAEASLIVELRLQVECHKKTVEQLRSDLKATQEKIAERIAAAKVQTQLIVEESRRHEEIARQRYAEAESRASKAKERALKAECWALQSQKLESVALSALETYKAGEARIAVTAAESAKSYDKLIENMIVNRTEAQARLRKAKRLLAYVRKGGFIPVTISNNPPKRTSSIESTAKT